jgi:hypothetical protein
MKPEERSTWIGQGHSTMEPRRDPMTDEEIEQLSRRLKESGEIAAAQRLKQREKQDIEVKQLVAELHELRKLLPQEEIDFEEALRESEAYYKAIPMYDWGAREKSNEYDMSQKYGSKIINEIRRCEQDAQFIPKSLIADMHRIHEGRAPLQRNKNKAAIRHSKESHKSRMRQARWNETQNGTSLEPKQYRNGHFSTVKAGLFNIARGNRELHNPTTLLLYLLQHRAWEGKKDKHDTYDTWYLKRSLIVASVGVEKICADLGVHEKTVRNWTNVLHNSGVIKKLKEGQENVYILGEVIDNKELFYYSGEISWKMEPRSVH